MNLSDVSLSFNSLKACSSLSVHLTLSGLSFLVSSVNGAAISAKSVDGACRSLPNQGLPLLVVLS